MLLRYMKLYLEYAESLVSDLSPEQMVAQPATEHAIIVNHATWQIGHIVTTTCPMVEILQDDALSQAWIHWLCKGPEEEIAYPNRSVLPEQWMAWFDTGTDPLSGKAAEAYPGKDEMMSMLARSHEGLKQWMEKNDDEALAAETPIGAVQEMAPTIGHTLMLILIHEAQHLGELAAWRRALGFKRRF